MNCGCFSLYAAPFCCFCLCGFDFRFIAYLYCLSLLLFYCFDAHSRCFCLEGEYSSVPGAHFFLGLHIGRIIAVGQIDIEFIAVTPAYIRGYLYIEYSAFFLKALAEYSGSAVYVAGGKEEARLILKR